MASTNMCCESPSGSEMGTRRRGGRRMSQRILHLGTAIFLILTYYGCSIGLTFYQKHLVTNFRFPLTMVVIHLIIKFLLAGTCRTCYTCYTGQSRVRVGWTAYWKRILPPGAAAAFDIAFSQWALEYVTITLYTMTKSTALVFILFFAILFKLEEMNFRMIIIVLFIAGGLVMFTYKYTEFILFGFLLALLASFLSGLRWTLSQMVMQKEELGLGNPIDMVYHIQPWMVIAVLPLALIVEGKDFANSEYVFNMTDYHKASIMWLRILGGAFLAFLMEVSEYLVICFTSSLNFSIAGVGKEILTLSLSVSLGHEHLSFINETGLVLCVIGILIHVILKARYGQIKHQPASPKPSTEGAITAPLLDDTESLEASME